MKFLTLFLTLICSFTATAHTDHTLGEGLAHYVYHVVFWSIFAAVIVKAVVWYKKSKAQPSDLDNKN